jgi:hypothetical protein
MQRTRFAAAVLVLLVSAACGDPAGPSQALGPGTARLEIGGTLGSGHVVGEPEEGEGNADGEGSTTAIGGTLGSGHRACDPVADPTCKP